jgi:hypothetical protein
MANHDDDREVFEPGFRAWSLMSTVRVHPQHRAAQSVIPRHLVPEPIRHRQDPLPHRHPRQHRVHEVGGALRHPATTTTGTPRPPFVFTRRIGNTNDLRQRSPPRGSRPRDIRCQTRTPAGPPRLQSTSSFWGSRGSAQGTSAGHVSVACCCRAGVNRTGSETFGEHVVVTETRI